MFDCEIRAKKLYCHVQHLNNIVSVLSVNERKKITFNFCTQGYKRKKKDQRKKKMASKSAEQLPRKQVKLKLSWFKLAGLKFTNFKMSCAFCSRCTISETPIMYWSDNALGIHVCPECAHSVLTKENFAYKEQANGLYEKYTELVQAHGKDHPSVTAFTGAYKHITANTTRDTIVEIDFMNVAFCAEKDWDNASLKWNYPSMADAISVGILNSGFNLTGEQPAQKPADEKKDDQAPSDVAVSTATAPAAAAPKPVAVKKEPRVVELDE